MARSKTTKQTAVKAVKKSQLSIDTSTDEGAALQDKILETWRRVKTFDEVYTACADDVASYAESIGKDAPKDVRVWLSNFKVRWNKGINEAADTMIGNAKAEAKKRGMTEKQFVDAIEELRSAELLDNKPRGRGARPQASAVQFQSALDSILGNVQSKAADKPKRTVKRTVKRGQ